MQWPPLDAGDYEFLRRFKFRPQRVWDDEAALCDAAVGQVLLLGDIHNNRQVLDAALRTAGDEGCDVLVQVGDFWLQSACCGDPKDGRMTTMKRNRHTPEQAVRKVREGERMLANWRGFAPDRAGAMCCAVNAEIPVVVVVDGNHEVRPSLTAFQKRHDTAAARAAGRPLHLGGSLWWADRGSTWSWAGRRFGALGGSASPDRWIPSVAPWRWEQENNHQRGSCSSGGQRRRRAGRADMPRRARPHPRPHKRTAVSHSPTSPNRSRHSAGAATRSRRRRGA